MSRDISDLEPSFRVKVEDLLSACEGAGFPMKQFFTLRSPFEQGKLWRQSRSTRQIQEKLAELNSKSADFLAYCIESVGPQTGRHVTNAIPGLSWHQWGEAVDCFWLLDGNAEWSTTKKVGGINGYRNYANIANSLLLDAGGLWRSLKDWPHVQLRKTSNPSKVYSLKEINDEMENKFASDA